MTDLRRARKDGQVKPPTDKRPMTLYEAMRDENRPRCTTCNTYDDQREIGSICLHCQQQGGAPNNTTQGGV